MSYFGLIMVRDISNKIGPLGDVLKTFGAGWFKAFSKYKSVHSDN